MSEQQYEIILEIAESRWRANQRGYKSQLCHPKDGLDYWVALTAFEMGSNVS